MVSVIIKHNARNDSFISEWKFKLNSVQRLLTGRLKLKGI